MDADQISTLLVAEGDIADEPTLNYSSFLKLMLDRTRECRNAECRNAAASASSAAAPAAEGSGLATHGSGGSQGAVEAPLAGYKATVSGAASSGATTSSAASSGPLANICEDSAEQLPRISGWESASQGPTQASSGALRAMGSSRRSPLNSSDLGYSSSHLDWNRKLSAMVEQASGRWAVAEDLNS